MKKNPAILGAAFLMATSAIGPGFLTQTSKFTQDLLTSFGFVILISVLLDIGAQLNIWRIITVTENRAQDIANKLVPGLGFLLATLIAFGGLVFNIGNIAGCGLGAEVLTGADVKIGAAISGAIALAIFWYKDAGKLIDIFVKILGLLMIMLTLYVAISSHPPLGEALYRTIWPEKINEATIVTLVGGTVGGYISFAGAHRLLDAGIKGKENLGLVTRSSVSGILITSFMRFILFLAALGVVWNGTQLSDGNPAASVFRAAGGLGYTFFGIVLWSAAITSVIGASYTVVSFWKTLVPAVQRNEKIIVSCFIILSVIIFISIGSPPVQLLILAGAVNGLILPLALAVILAAAANNKSSYRHPRWLYVIGWAVVAIMTWLGYSTIVEGFNKL